jgi:predicted nucleotidyltransferase
MVDSKSTVKELRQRLRRLAAQVNKYEIYDAGGALSVYSGSKLSLILPDLIELLESSIIRYMRSVVTNLITKTGEGAREALPIFLSHMLTSDKWLISGYSYAIEQLGWTYKHQPRDLATYITHLEAIIEEDNGVIAMREHYTRQLAMLVDAADDIQHITGADVLAMLEGRVVISNTVWNTCCTREDEVGQVATQLYKLEHHTNRRKALQEVLERLDFHSKTGWQSQSEIYQAVSTFLQQFPVVRAVKIFGSRASSTYRADSDIDLALVLRIETPDEALETYRQNHQTWYAWLAKQLPYEIDLNLYVDKQTTPEIHNGIYGTGKGEWSIGEWP